MRSSRRIGIPVFAALVIGLAGAPGAFAASAPSHPTPQPPGCVIVVHPGQPPLSGTTTEKPGPGKPGECGTCEGGVTGPGQSPVSSKPGRCDTCIITIQPGPGGGTTLPPKSGTVSERPGPGGPGECGFCGITVQPGSGNGIVTCGVCVEPIQPGKPGSPVTTTRSAPGEPVPPGTCVIPPVGTNKSK